MIKLIASDLDGTLLLNGTQTVSNEMFDIIRELKKRDILFVAASGRQYPNLKRLFEPVFDDIAFISENGALVMYKDDVVSKSPLEREMGTKIAEEIIAHEKCEVVISGKNTCYLMPKTDKFFKLISQDMENKFTIIKNISEIEEDLLKVSICAMDGVEGELTTDFTKRWGKHASVAVSGHVWLDFNHATANKGNGIVTLQNLFNINKEESMAFGDNFNDIKMLQAVDISYAMVKAKDPIKNVSKFRTEKVEDTLLRFLKEI